MPTPANRVLAQALEHPLRAQIATELESREADPLALASALGEPLPLVSYHHAVLAAVGLT